MADSSIDKKTQQINNMRVEKGKEYQVYQKAQNQLLQIQAAQRQALSNQRAISNSQAYQMATMKQAAQLAAMNGGQGAYQQRVNPQTQAALSRYGVGMPRFQRQQSSSQQKQGQNVVIHNHNTTNTTNNVDARGAYGGPVQGRALAFKDNNIAFKSWISAAFAKQNEQAQIRERNYEKREAALTRDSNKMMRKLEGVGKTIGERLDPRKLTSGMGNQFKVLMLMLGLKFIKDHIKEILERVSNMWLGFKFFLKKHLGIDLDRANTSSTEGRLSGSRYRTLIRNGVDRANAALVAAFGGNPDRGDTIGDVLKWIIIGDDKHPDGLFLQLKDFLEIAIKDRANAVKTYASTKADKMSGEFLKLAMSDHPMAALTTLIPYLTNILGIAIGGSNYVETAVIKDIQNDFYKNNVRDNTSTNNRLVATTSYRGIAITDENGKDPKAIIAEKMSDGKLVLTDAGRNLGYILENGSIKNTNYNNYVKLKARGDKALNSDSTLLSEFANHDLYNDTEDSIFQNSKLSGTAGYKYYQGDLRFRILKDKKIIGENVTFDDFIERFKRDESYRNQLRKAITTSHLYNGNPQEKDTHLRYLDDFEKLIRSHRGSSYDGKSDTINNLNNGLRLSISEKVKSSAVSDVKLGETNVTENTSGAVSYGYLEGCKGVKEGNDTIFDMGQEGLTNIQFSGSFPLLPPDSLSNITTATIVMSNILSEEIRDLNSFSASWSTFNYINNTLKRYSDNTKIAISPKFNRGSIGSSRKKSIGNEYIPFIRDKMTSELTKETLGKILDIFIEHKIAFEGAGKILGTLIQTAKGSAKGIKNWASEASYVDVIRNVAMANPAGILNDPSNNLGISVIKEVLKKNSLKLDLADSLGKDTETFLGDLRTREDYNKFLKDEFTGTVRQGDKTFTVKKKKNVVVKIEDVKAFREGDYAFLKTGGVTCYTITKSDWDNFVRNDLKLNSMNFEIDSANLSQFAEASGASSIAEGILNNNTIIDTRNYKKNLEVEKEQRYEAAKISERQSRIIDTAISNARKGDYEYHGIKKNGEKYILDENTRVQVNGKDSKGHCAAAVTSFYEYAGVKDLRGNVWVTDRNNKIVPGETNITKVGFKEVGNFSYDKIGQLDNPEELGITPGDVMLAWGRKNGVLKQHAAIWDGEKWISDFEQKRANVYGDAIGAAGDRSIQIYRYAGGKNDVKKTIGILGGGDESSELTWESFLNSAKSGYNSAKDFISRKGYEIYENIKQRGRNIKFGRRDILGDVEALGLSKDSSIFTDYDVYKSLGGTADFQTWKANSRYLTGKDVIERGFNGGGKMLEYLNGGKFLPDAPRYNSTFIGEQGLVDENAFKESLKSFFDQDKLTPEAKISKANGDKLTELIENIKLVIRSLDTANSLSNSINAQAGTITKLLNEKDIPV